MAFNAQGQVQPVLDISSIALDSNAFLLRMGEDRAIAFFANNDRPKAFLLTADAAATIGLPSVTPPVPGNGWEVLAEHEPYVVIGQPGDATTPAILINGQNGQARQLAPDVFGPSVSDYFVRFSADGRWLRFVTAKALGEGAIEVHDLDLQTGREAAVFQMGSYIRTDAYGDVWVDTAAETAWTANGQRAKLRKTGNNMDHWAIANQWILDSSQDCDQPCALQAYPATGATPGATYSLPVKLKTGSVEIWGAEMPSPDHLVVLLSDTQGSSTLGNLWLLTPDGQSRQMGKGMLMPLGQSPSGWLPGSSPDGRYILVYPADDKAAFAIYDLVKGTELFSEAVDKPQAFLEATYLHEGLIVREQGDTVRQWLYAYAGNSATEVQPPQGQGECTAMTPDGKPVCITEDGVSAYDPSTGHGNRLVQEPVTDVSN